MIKKKEKEYIIIIMVIDMMVNGLTIKWKVLVDIILKMVILKKGNIKEVKKLVFIKNILLNMK